MEEKILQAILEEIKGLRSDTNARFISLENRIGNVEDGITISNQQLDSLENKVGESNKRLGSLENKFEGFKSSVEVLQIGVNQVRYELIGIKDILGTKVIWQNETITLEVKDGTKIYGTIHKGEK